MLKLDCILCVFAADDLDYEVLVHTLNLGEYVPEQLIKAEQDLYKLWRQGAKIECISLNRLSGGEEDGRVFLDLGKVRQFRVLNTLCVPFVEVAKDI